MDRFVVMVDAGYLLRQAVEIASNRQSHTRGDLQVTDPAGLIETLICKSKAMLALDGKELLRVYWYDGVMANGLTRQQRAIVDVNDVQFRAGTINSAKQQKGVDSLIVTDLIELTTHHAICDAILVTGDSDLAVGIEIAQKRGVRIGVMGIEDLGKGVAHQQSWEITSRADRIGRLGSADISHTVAYSPKVPPVPAAAAIDGAASTEIVSPPPGAVSTQSQPQRYVSERPLTDEDRHEITNAVKEFIAKQPPEVNAVDTVTNRIHADVDRALIHHVFTCLSRGKLTDSERIFARAEFRSMLAA